MCRERFRAYAEHTRRRLFISSGMPPCRTQRLLVANTIHLLVGVERRVMNDTSPHDSPQLHTISGHIFDPAKNKSIHMSPAKVKPFPPTSTRDRDPFFPPCHSTPPPPYHIPMVERSTYNICRRHPYNFRSPNPHHPRPTTAHVHTLCGPAWHA